VLWFSISFAFTGYNQKNILQIDLSGGLNVPMGSMRETFMFAGEGYHLGSHIDFFMGQLGLGVAIGYTQNSSSELFQRHIEKKYLETITFENPQSWRTKYMVFGPSYRLAFKKWDFNIFAKAGISQPEAPSLMFQKYFYGQPYEIFRFKGQNGDFQYIWNAGLRGMYNVNSWCSIMMKAEYLSTDFLSQMGYSYSYFNASDINNNGIIDDPEYGESEEIFKSGDVTISSINISAGVVFKIGRINGRKKVKIIPEEIIEVSQTAPSFVAEPENTTTILSPETKVISQTPPVAEVQTVSEDVEQPLEDIQVADAPESKYDEEAARFLYKAGESYFAANNFDAAMACFNKLKSDPHYPRAKYMFALSQCAVGNCLDAKKEYTEFAAQYNESDSRTLEVIFASHLERCKQGDLLVNAVKNERPDTSTSVKTKEYRVQFVAIKKSDAAFPKVAQIGTIVTEFFPNKTLYRYTLDGYQTLNVALEDMKAVRRLGFKDAFIAVYENGIRTKTLYHAR
jgi:hypothetical protein